VGGRDAERLRDFAAAIDPTPTVAVIEARDLESNRLAETADVRVLMIDLT